MNIQRRLDELAAEVKECGECLLNSYTRRNFMPYLNERWKKLFRQHASDEPVEMYQHDLEEFTEVVRANLVASVAAKLTS